MRGVVGVIWGKREADYFCRHGWTAQIALIGLTKSAFSRNAFWRDLRGLRQVAWRTGAAWRASRQTAAPPEIVALMTVLAEDHSEPPPWTPSQSRNHPRKTGSKVLRSPRSVMSAGVKLPTPAHW